MREAGRAGAVADVACSVVAGWLVAIGLSASLWLGDTTPWSALPFFIGGVACIALLNLADRLFGPAAAGRPMRPIPWFSEIAARHLRVSRLHLARRADVAGIPVTPVVVAAWAPWWALVAFWVFLVSNGVFLILNAAADVVAQLPATKNLP